MKQLFFLISFLIIFSSCREQEGMLERKHALISEQPEKPLENDNDGDNSDSEDESEETEENKSNEGTDLFYIFNKNHLSCNPLGNPNVENKVIAEVRVLKEEFSTSTKFPNNLQTIQDKINEPYHSQESQVHIDLNHLVPTVLNKNGESRFSAWCRSALDSTGQCTKPPIPSFYQAYIEFYLDDYYSQKIEGTLFESAINVSPRKFDTGFPLSDGSLLKNPNNNNQPLLEHFNINFKTDIKLQNESEEGWYDFAFLRDDGAILSIFEMDTKGNVLKEYDRYIYSPQFDAPYFACRSNDTDLIYLKKDKIYRVIVNYFQGPRMRISLQLFWKKSLENLKNLSTHCMSLALDRNYCIINSTDNSCKKSANGEPSVVVNYENFINEGWEVIPSQYLNLPGSMIDQCKYENIDELQLQNKPEGDITISIKQVVGGVEEISTYVGKIDVQDKKIFLDPAITTEVDKVITVKYKYL